MSQIQTESPLAPPDVPPTVWEMVSRAIVLMLVVAAGFYILGAMASMNLNPVIVTAFLVNELPSLLKYQIYSIIKAFQEYDLLTMLGSLAFLMIIGSAVSLIVLEVIIYAVQCRSLSKAWKRTSLYRIIFGEQSERTDLYLYLYYCFSLDRFVIAALGILGPFFIYGLLVNGGSLNLAVNLPHFVQFLLYILLADFLAYWFHRIAHTTTALWELHKFHHSATSMNFITAHRNHPLEVAMQLPLRAIPIIALGPSVEEYLLYTALHHFVILLQHSNFNFSFGWLDHVFVSPRFHLVHHSSKPVHFDQNYGVVFSFWDDIFRSRYKGDDFDPEYGVTDNYFNNKGFVSDINVPFAKFGKALISKRKIS